MVMTVDTYPEVERFIYMHPGTMDAISLVDIKEGDQIVVVKNCVKKIYLYQSYITSMRARMQMYGLGANEVIDPSVPTVNNAIPVEEIGFYTARFINNTTILSADSLIVLDESV